MVSLGRKRVDVIGGQQQRGRRHIFPFLFPTCTAKRKCQPGVIPLLLTLALPFGVTVPAQGQDCAYDFPGFPVDNRSTGPYEAWCVRHGGIFHQGPSCTKGPNWCPEERRSDPPPPPPPPPPPDPEAIRKEVEAERAAKAAEEKRKADEKFQSDKKDILGSMKGVSPGDLGLKGPDDGSDSLGLKGPEDGPKVPPLSEAERIYLRRVALPAACVVGTDLKASAACMIVDVDELGKALQGPNPVLAVEKLLLENVRTKAIVISLKLEESQESRMEVIKAMYEGAGDALEYIYETIIKETQRDRAKQARMKELAKLDSAALKRIKQQIIAEKDRNVQASEDYLRQDPRRPGIRFNCSTACRQMIQAAKAVDAME